MKKIIGQKRYDTDTAQEVGTYTCSNRSDFHYIKEVLYRKKTGEFFLHGEGGAASKYAETIEQNAWRGGEKIIPMPYEAAQVWAEERLTGDDYEAIFGEVAEDDGHEQIGCTVTAAAAAMLRRMSSTRGQTTGEIIEALVREAYESGDSRGQADRRLPAEDRSRSV